MVVTKDQEERESTLQNTCPVIEAACALKLAALQAHPLRTLITRSNVHVLKKKMTCLLNGDLNRLGSGIMQIGLIEQENKAHSKSKR